MTQKVLGNPSEGLLFVLSAPAGTGKTTLARMLCEEFSCVVESVSSTTRLPRSGEVAGKDYHFLSIEDFEAKIQKGDFLEYAKVFGHYYGTSKESVFLQQKNGKHVILVIDTQGAMQLFQKGISATSIFVSPPSLEELRERLLKRQTECNDSLEKRLAWAQEEIKMAVHYQYHIVNEDLNVAYDILRSIVIAEEHRTRS